jgi:RNA polymerase sigma-B factor
LSVRDSRIDQYRYLCRRGARKFIRRGLDAADLEQVAAVGLIKAADRYDATSGTPFEAYAWITILGELMHYVRDHERLVRLPRSVRELVRRYRQGVTELMSWLGRAPTPQEIAQNLGLAVDDIAEVEQAATLSDCASLDALEGRNDSCRAYQSAVAAPFEERIALHDALSVLTEAERAIVVGLYSWGYTKVELGKRLRFSERHIARLHQRAITKIQRAWI